MLPMFERRQQRLEKLFEEIEETDDAVLKTVLRSGDPEQLSVVLAIFSIERAGRVLVDVAAERLADGMALLKHGAPPPERAVIRLAAALSRARADRGDVPIMLGQAAAPTAPADDTPLVVKAMDAAGRVLGARVEK